MGKFSRDKGARIERSVRDVLIAQGWACKRIPLSGAVKGFEGDLLAEKDGKQLTLEVKGRADSFKAIYRFGVPVDTINIGGECIAFGTDLAQVCRANFFTSWLLEPSCCKDCDRILKALVRKLLSLKKLLGEAQILVVKDDRKPPIFIRYV